MAKYELMGRTLDDEVVRDSLVAISQLDLHGEKTKDLSYVVGGMATQGYIPAEHRRKTCDLDLSLLIPLNYEGFKDFSTPVRNYLGSKGYVCETKKSSSNYKVLMSKDDETLFTIEFSRRSPSIIERRIGSLMGEFRNSRKKFVEGGEQTYRVSSPEDIAVPKLARCLSSLRRNHGFREHLKSFPINFDSRAIKEAKGLINSMREDASIDLGDPSVAEEFRFISDLYDIRLLSDYVGFNQDYLDIAAGRWENLVPTNEMDHELISTIIPSLS
jgi:hypothetical protein